MVIENDTNDINKKIIKIKIFQINLNSFINILKYVKFCIKIIFSIYNFLYIKNMI